MNAKTSSYFIGGIAIALLGSICFSTKAIFVKLAYRDTPVDAVSLLALRMLIALPFFLAFAWSSSRKEGNIRFTLKQWGYVAAVGCLGYYISSLLDFLGLQYISAGMERLILFIYPTLVVLMSSLWFKEKIRGVQWVALIVTYVGLALTFAGEISIMSNDKDNFYLGSLLVFACAFTFAAYVVGSGRLIPVLGASKFNSYAMSFASIGVLLHFFISSGGQSLFQFTPLVYGYSFSMAILSTVIPSFLITEGIKRIGPGNASIVASIGPVSTLVQANLFLNEPVYALQVAGTTIILVGVMLVGWKPGRIIP